MKIAHSNSDLSVLVGKSGMSNQSNELTNGRGGIFANPTAARASEQTDAIFSYRRFCRNLTLSTRNKIDGLKCRWDPVIPASEPDLFLVERESNWG